MALFYRMLFIFGLVAGLPENGVAQTRPYVYQHLDREDGLASSIVLAILQDSQGYMWFGTDNGLQRYDGRQFTHYRFELNNPNSLASDIVEALLQDGQGNLWIASPGFVTRFSVQQHTFHRIPIVSAAGASNLPQRWRLQQCEGRILLLSGNGQETYVYHASRNAFVFLLASQLDTLSCSTKTLAPATSLPPPAPYVHLQDKRGAVWAAGEALWVRRPGQTAFEQVPKNSNARYGIDYNQIYSIAQNREGTLWLGTDRGVYFFNPEKQPFFTVEAETMGSANGQPQAPAAITGFLETKAGEVFASSINNGIKVYDQQFRLRCDYSQSATGKPLQAWCLAEDRLNRVWAGSSDGTLLLLENDGAAVVRLSPPALAGQTMVKAATDAAGNIWWGTNKGQLFQHNTEKNSFRQFALQPQIGGQQTGQIQRILFAADGSLWVGTSQAGVLHLHAETGELLHHFATTTRPGGLLSNAVGEITWLNNDTLLVSTNLGLHFLDVKSKQVKALTTADGLPSNTILNLVKASDRYLFFTSQISLSRWDLRTGSFTGYGAHDGLLNESYAFNTGYRLHDGRMLLGTLQGFYYFHPDSLEKSPAPPNVAITGFRIFDKNIPLLADAVKDGGISLAYKQNFFTVEFAALDYYNEAKITYEYQLEGVDPDWRKGGRNRFASYTNLDGGNYRFKVRARRDDGTTSAEVTTLALRIANPFWKSAWFWALVLLVLAAILYGLYKLKVNRLLALQQVRTRIARDLHDDMGSTLSTITIFSDMAKHQVLSDPGLAQGYLDKISRYSHAMMSAMDDIVWSVNPHNDSLQNLVSRMRELATELLEAKDIAFTIQADAGLNTTRLPLESRYDCFMIYKEALNNLAKYADCKQVWIKINTANHMLQLEIIDDGQGFDVQTANSGNGLQNMQKRAQHMKGHLKISSAKGSGTAILLAVPLPKINFKTAKL